LLQQPALEYAVAPFIAKPIIDDIEEKIAITNHIPHKQEHVQIHERFNERTTSKMPALSVNALGSGGAFSGFGKAKQSKEKQKIWLSLTPVLRADDGKHDSLTW
jgi:hypothetical protein